MCEYKGMTTPCSECGRAVCQGLSFCGPCIAQYFTPICEEDEMYIALRKKHPTCCVDQHGLPPTYSCNCSRLTSFEDTDFSLCGPQPCDCGSPFPDHVPGGTHCRRGI